MKNRKNKLQKNHEWYSGYTYSEDLNTWVEQTYWCYAHHVSRYDWIQYTPTSEEKELTFKHNLKVYAKNLVKKKTKSVIYNCK